jgi:transposase
MLRLPRSIRVFASTTPVGARTNVDALVTLVREEIGEDPFKGNLFCFFNRRRDQVKLLVWDRNGFWVFCKRLERGWYEALDVRTPYIEIGRERLVQLLSGIDMKTARFRRRFPHDVRMASRVDDDARSARTAE